MLWKFYHTIKIEKKMCKDDKKLNSLTKNKTEAICILKTETKLKR